MLLLCSAAVLRDDDEQHNTAEAEQVNNSWEPLELHAQQHRSSRAVTPAALTSENLQLAQPQHHQQQSPRQHNVRVLSSQGRKQQQQQEAAGYLQGDQSHRLSAAYSNDGCEPKEGITPKGSLPG